MNGTELLPLVGIPIVVIGFAIRFNPLLVVVVAGLATGLLTGMDFGTLLETFGEKFASERLLIYQSIPWACCHNRKHRGQRAV